MLKFEELVQYIPECEDYASEGKASKVFVDACKGFIIRCESYNECANSTECTKMANLKKVEDK